MYHNDLIINPVKNPITAHKHTAMYVFIYAFNFAFSKCCSNFYILSELFPYSLWHSYIRSSFTFSSRCFCRMSSTCSKDCPNCSGRGVETIGSDLLMMTKGVLNSDFAL